MNLVNLPISATEENKFKDILKLVTRSDEECKYEGRENPTKCIDGGFVQSLPNNESNSIFQHQINHEGFIQDEIICVSMEPLNTNIQMNILG